MERTLIVGDVILGNDFDMVATLTNHRNFDLWILISWSINNLHKEKVMFGSNLVMIDVTKDSCSLARQPNVIKMTSESLTLSQIAANASFKTEIWMMKVAIV